MHDKLTEYEDKLEAAEGILNLINLDFWPRLDRRLMEIAELPITKADLKSEKRKKQAVTHYYNVNKKYNH